MSTEAIRRTGGAVGGGDRRHDGGLHRNGVPGRVVRHAEDFPTQAACQSWSS